MSQIAVAILEDCCMAFANMQVREYLQLEIASDEKDQKKIWTELQV